MLGRLKHLWNRPGFANVIAMVALFIALGGASYAAIQIPKNSVGNAQLKKNAVDSKKVRDRSLLASDFKKGQLPRGARGVTGSAGATGATGATGASTTAILTGVTNLPTASDRYFGISGATTPVIGANVRQVTMAGPPVATTASNLTATFDGQPNSPASRTLTLVRVTNLAGGDGEITPTSLTCTVSDKYICTNTGKVNIPAWSQLALLSTSAGSPDPVWVRFSLSIGP